MEVREQLRTVEAVMKYVVNESQVMLHEARFDGRDLEMLQKMVVTKVRRIFGRRACQPDQKRMLNAFQPLQVSHRCARPDHAAIFNNGADMSVEGTQQRFAFKLCAP